MESVRREFDLVALREDSPVDGLIAGDVGTVVFVHDDGAAYEVGFVTADGGTLAVKTLNANDVAPISGKQILHVRSLAVA
jgi:hypothetical protein